MEGPVQLDRLAQARGNQHDRTRRAVDRAAKRTNRCRGRFADLPATTAQQALWRIVDQASLPIVELLQPDIAGDQRRVEGAGEIKGKTGGDHRRALFRRIRGEIHQRKFFDIRDFDGYPAYTSLFAAL